MRILGQYLTESLKLLLRQTLGQTLEARYKEWFNNIEKLVIADILSVELSLTLFNVEKYVI